MSKSKCGICKNVFDDEGSYANCEDCDNKLNAEKAFKDITYYVERALGYGATKEQIIEFIKGKSEPEITPKQLQINEIFNQANKDIAKLAQTNTDFDALGVKIDEIMTKARADANAIRKGEH